MRVILSTVSLVFPICIYLFIYLFINIRISLNLETFLMRNLSFLLTPPSCPRKLATSVLVMVWVVIRRGGAKRSHSMSPVLLRGCRDPWECSEVSCNVGRVWQGHTDTHTLMWRFIHTLVSCTCVVFLNINTTKRMSNTKGKIHHCPTTLTTHSPYFFYSFITTRKKKDRKTNMLV